MGEKRKLTFEEIDFIISSLPSYPNSAPGIAEKRLSEVKKRLYLILRFEITLDPQHLKLLSESINAQFSKALIISGMPIGIITAESIMAPITQATLNAFHFTGTEKGAVSGVTQMGEMTAASIKRKDPRLFCHFHNEDYTYDDVYNLSGKLIGITIHHLRDGQGEYHQVEMSEDEPVNDWWYASYLEENEFPNPSVRSQTFYRLKFDTVKLFQYSITTSDIANKIMINKDFVNGCWCVASPTKLGIVDVYADVDNLSSHEEITNLLNIVSDNQSISDIFFSKILIPKLEYITMKGISYNEYLTPMYHLTLDILGKTYPTEEEGYFICLIKRYEQRSKMIPISKLRKLLIAANLEVVDDPPLKVKEEVARISEDYFLVRSPTGVNPRKAITSALSEAEREDESGNKKYSLLSPPDIVRHSKYYYALIQGTERVNLEETLLIPEVDYTRTYSNEYHDVSRLFGIEVARQLMIFDYHTLLTDPYINSKYIINEVNIQTAPGYINSVSAIGSARQNTGTLTRASFQEATNTFVKAAIFGKEDSVKDTSSSVFLGKRIQIGTGGVFVVRDELKKEQLIGEQILSDIFNTENYNIDDIPAGIILGYGEKVLFSEFGDEKTYALLDWIVPPNPISRHFLSIPDFVTTSLTFNIITLVRNYAAPSGGAVNFEVENFLKSFT